MALPIQPIWPIVAVNGLDCCLAGSSKTAPRFLIFVNSHGCQTFILAEIILTNLGVDLLDDLLDNLLEKLRDNLGHVLGDNLRDNLWGNLLDNL